MTRLLRIEYKYPKEEKRKGNTGTAMPVLRWGYSQREVADYLGLPYSTVSRLIKESDFKTSKFKT